MWSLSLAPTRAKPIEGADELVDLKGGQPFARRVALPAGSLRSHARQNGAVVEAMMPNVVPSGSNLSIFISRTAW